MQESSSGPDSDVPARPASTLLKQAAPDAPRERERVCFELRVKPDRIPEYTRRHAAVWPDMLAALKASGWHNYSLFLRPDGLLIGYFETENLAEAQAAMERTEVNARWQAEMGEFFEDLDVPPDQGFLRIDEVFHLEDQLSAAAGTNTPAQGAEQ